MEIDNKPRTNASVDEHPNSAASLGSDCEKKAGPASGSQTEISINEVSQSQNRRKRKQSESDCDPGMG